MTTQPSDNNASTALAPQGLTAMPEGLEGVSICSARQGDATSSKVPLSESAVAALLRCRDTPQVLRFCRQCAAEVLRMMPCCGNAGTWSAGRGDGVSMSCTATSGDTPGRPGVRRMRRGYCIAVPAATASLGPAMTFTALNS
jgi:hypothetical protein